MTADWFNTAAKTSSNVEGSDASKTNIGLVWGDGGGVYGSDTSGLNKRLITAFPRLRDKYGWDGYINPTWSRTGRRLAYQTWASGGSNVNVFTKATRKGVTLATATVWAADPAWAPDEDRLAYYNFPDHGTLGLGSGGYISVVSLSSGRKRILIAPQPGRRDQQPAWSPDGKTIAFVRERYVPDRRWGSRSTPLVIHLVNASGRGSRRLTAGSSPSWSANSKRIAFAAADGVYVIGADGSGRRRLVRVPPSRDNDLNPKWSPDGSTIMYVWGGRRLDDGCRRR